MKGIPYTVREARLALKQMGYLDEYHRHLYEFLLSLAEKGAKRKGAK